MLGQIFLGIASFWMMINLALHPPDFYSMVPYDLGGDASGVVKKTGYINVDGGKLYYEKAGQGETMVFIHDGLVHCETWDKQFDHFAENYQVIRYDRRGYGRSDSARAAYCDIKDLRRLFDQLEISQAHVIGCSAGGRLAIDFTLAYPEKVKSLVLVGGVLSGFGLTEHFYSRGGLAQKEDFEDPERLIQFLVFEDPYEIAPENTAVKEKVASILKANPQNVTATRGGFLQRPPAAVDKLSEIDVPALIVVGEKDIPDVHAHAGVINAGIKGSRRIIVEGSGHLVHMEQPEVFNFEVIRFLNFGKLFTVMKKEGAEKAYAMFKEILLNTPDKIPFEESSINILGYDYLQRGQVEDALFLFKMNMEAFPKSYNVYDSYAEAQLASGDTAGAIMNYKKSLELNPDNSNAAVILKNIRRE